VLLGRRSHRHDLDRLLVDVREGKSAVRVVRGEPGVGKTALLDYLAERASGCSVARAAGIQSEMELPYAGLHQLCWPMRDELQRLPGPQRDALGTVFGLHQGDAPNRFIVGLAVLSLLSEVAGKQPLVCVVDDAHWLDRESAQALAFVARRLLAESVAIVFAVRTAADELAGLPELEVEGLDYRDARALLDSALPAPLDARVREQIVAETGGNPLALLELARTLTRAELAGGFALAEAVPRSAARTRRSPHVIAIEEIFGRRLRALAPPTRTLLLIAAADPLGEPTNVIRAAEQLGIGLEAAAPAVDAELLEFGARVRFRHPLVRSTVYRAATAREVQEAHGALAAATDPAVDPDRRAWHRAKAAPGPDEDVARELERSAGRAQARGGVAATAAFLEHAVRLTRDPARRSRRALTAAQAKHLAGAHETARELLTVAEAGPLDELQHGHADLLRGQIAATASRGNGAPSLLLAAARRLEPLDVATARETYLELLAETLFAGPLASDVGLIDAARAAQTAPPPPGTPRPSDLLLDGYAVTITDGHAAGAPTLKRALSAFRRNESSSAEGLRWLWLACVAAMDLWDDESWHELSTRFTALARDAGALAVLPIALSARVGILVNEGRLDVAAAVVDEIDEVSAATRTSLGPYAGLSLAAWQGDDAKVAALSATSMEEVIARGEGIGLSMLHWTHAFLHNSAGRSEEALSAAERALEYPATLLYGRWGLIELVEAAARSGHPERALDAVERLAETTQASGTEWAQGVELRSRALVSDGDTADRLYRDAISHLARTRVRVELARAHLLYGEWLRRERRRRDAREQLRTAYEMLVAMNADALTDRAERELMATGETVRERTAAIADQLTSQEAEVARLAHGGLSNAEIGARLFISPRTVEYHLRKVFAKLGIGSRQQLGAALAERPPNLLTR
jgi:DNA-binding CsgD family transcriptional regulator